MSNDSPTVDVSDLVARKLAEFTEQENPHVVAKKIYQDFINHNTYNPERLGAPHQEGTTYNRTPREAINVYEFIDQVRYIVGKVEGQEGKAEQNQVLFSYTEGEKPAQTPLITAEVTRREPGAFAEGAPFRGDVKNYRPIVRERVMDPEDGRYQKTVLGYWFDNMVTFTCWSQTNKGANDLSIWFEDLMFDWTWFFRYCGVQKLLYYGRDDEVAREFDNNKFYSRRINYFVRTERLVTFSERKLAKIIIDITTSNNKYMDEV